MTSDLEYKQYLERCISSIENEIEEDNIYGASIDISKYMDLIGCLKSLVQYYKNIIKENNIMENKNTTYETWEKQPYEGWLEETVLDDADYISEDPGFDTYVDSEVDEYSTPVEVTHSDVIYD